MTSETGLHDRVNRISHWDVNVSDLERSRRWYEATTPLKVVAETHSDQAFGALGLKRGAFRGCMLKDVNQDGGFPMIHLVEWRDPLPVGRPYDTHAHVGWYRITAKVRDVEVSRQDVLAAGGTPFAETTDTTITFHPESPEGPYRTFLAHDPDGITVQFAHGFGVVPKTPMIVAHNTAAVGEHLPFYLETLGLDFLQGSQTPDPIPNIYDEHGGETRLDGAFFGLRGDRRMFFDWLQWEDSRLHPTPYQEPTHLGIMRCALEVDDLDRSREILLSSTWHRRGKISVSERETWDFGPAIGPLDVVTFTDPEGVGFQLVQQHRSRLAQIHPYGRPLFD